MAFTLLLIFRQLYSKHNAIYKIWLYMNGHSVDTEIQLGGYTYIVSHDTQHLIWTLALMEEGIVKLSVLILLFIALMKAGLKT
jgi:hypothetical protein